MHKSVLRIVVLLIIFLSVVNSANAAVIAKINYSVPIDYSNLSEQEISEKAKKYFEEAYKLTPPDVDENMTNALMLYYILQKINPNNVDYSIKLGALLDRVDKDLVAKSYFSKSLGLDSSNPHIYFFKGEFYYRREMYRKALKNYITAYTLGLNTSFELLYKMGDIYEKFGDTSSALKYLNEAFLQSSTPELEAKIRRVESNHLLNAKYYADTRIRERI